jgi:hypothetical protein
VCVAPAGLIPGNPKDKVKTMNPKTMNRYLIEVPHEPSHDECPRLAASLLRSGTHFVTRSDWGCEAGEHRSWLSVEALDDRDAALIVPPILRSRARVVRLNTYGTEDLEEDVSRASFQLPETVVA